MIVQYSEHGAKEVNRVNQKNETNEADGGENMEMGEMELHSATTAIKRLND